MKRRCVYRPVKSADKHRARDDRCQAAREQREFDGRERHDRPEQMVVRARDELRAPLYRVSTRGEDVVLCLLCADNKV